ncbi:MAG TPA: thermonuclease family protein [Candidatus Peribacteraceae bacterium]|nr:thermonuclease family protein [Candidatus Peribacteraceae bacterium]
MRTPLTAILLLSLLSPQALSAAAGPFWGTDTFIDSMLKRREERREARAKERFDTPPQLHQVRIGWNIITKPSSPRRRRNVLPALVTGVVDGSVIVVHLPEDGNTEVRLLGVEAPEIVQPEDGVECFALEARDHLRETFAGTSVVLERDKRYNRDSYGRQIRYVRSGSQDIGAWMIWNGYAFADTGSPHLRLSDYEDLEADAQRHERGMWGYGCQYNDALEEMPVLE